MFLDKHNKHSKQKQTIQRKKKDHVMDIYFAPNKIAHLVDMFQSSSPLYKNWKNTLL